MRAWPVSLLLLAVTVDGALAEVPAGSVELTLKVPRDETRGGSQSEGDFIAPNEADIPRNFNAARCQCDVAGDSQYVLFEPTWVMRPMNPSGTQLFAWAGSSCGSASTEADRLMSCNNLKDIADALTLDGNVNLFVSVGDLVNPGSTAMDCSEDRTSVTYGLYTSEDAEATLDEVVAYQLDIDMRAPPIPDTVTVAAQEGQIALSWDAVSGNGSDIEYFQALCSRSDGARVHGEPTHPRRYDTPFTLCAASGGVELTELNVANLSDLADYPVVTEADLSDDLLELNGAFVCGQSSGGAGAGSIQLEDLDSGVNYDVVLLSVDRAGNVRAGFVPRAVAPVPVTDFWEDINEDNDELEGGLCLIESALGGGGSGGGGVYGALRAWRDELATTTAGRWLVERYYAWGAPIAAAAQQSVVVRVVAAIVLVPLIAIALVWHTLGLPLMLALIAALVLWRRRRRAVLAFAALIASPSLAAAQSNTPYWDDSIAIEDDTITGPRWHFGIRVGPFLPAIDESAGLTSRPYARMYGDGSWMPSFDLHRIFTTRFGQIGGGVSFGYFGKSADSWLPDSDTVRAENNPTKLRVVPIEATAIYRLSQIDDNWGIPLVPYARGGLAYSLWWVRRPDGELSKACDGTMAQCDRGIGASAGLVGAVGLSIRGERIDPDAARSMRDSGLDHAGFYAEISASWVDGFGSSKKLSLGDTTWSAGVDFEF